MNCEKRLDFDICLSRNNDDIPKCHSSHNNAVLATAAKPHLLPFLKNDVKSSCHPIYVFNNALYSKCRIALEVVSTKSTVLPTVWLFSNFT